MHGLPACLARLGPRASRAWARAGAAAQELLSHAAVRLKPAVHTLGGQLRAPAVAAAGLGKEAGGEVVGLQGV